MRCGADDLPEMACFQWEDSGMELDAPVRFIYCKRCSKSIARGRLYERLDYRAFDFCNRNHNPGCELVGPVAHRFATDANYRTPTAPLKAVSTASSASATPSFAPGIALDCHCALAQPKINVLTGPPAQQLLDGLHSKLKVMSEHVSDNDN